MVEPIFIDLTSDFGFKRLFGPENNKELLIAFLNAIFNGRKSMKDISYSSLEKIGDTQEIGSVIFDLLCIGDHGEQFIIKVLKSKTVNLKQRFLYYGAKLISDQAPKGNRHLWSYSINPVFVIVLMDGFSFSKLNANKTYIQEICLCNLHTGKIFQDDKHFIFI